MPYQFKQRRVVELAETDMAGIVHFSNFFRVMEEVEHAWWRSLGLSVVVRDAAEADEVHWPRVSASCDFTAPVQFEDELELRLQVTKLGGKSIAFEVEFTHDGKRIVAGDFSGEVRLWETADGKQLATLSPNPPSGRTSYFIWR